jgi:hypothetical protein
VTQFVWKSDDHVIAIDRGADGTTFVEAKVSPRGEVEIVDVYVLPADGGLEDG